MFSNSPATGHYRRLRAILTRIALRQKHEARRKDKRGPGVLYFVSPDKPAIRNVANANPISR